MVLQRRIQIRERSKILMLLITGLLVSILLVGRMGELRQQHVLEAGKTSLDRLAQSISRDQTGDQTESNSTQSGEQSERNGAILLGRILLPAIWILSSYTAWGGILLYLSWGYLGFSAGILLWLVMGTHGWRGPFVLWGLMFPQYLCYLPALVLLYVGCLRWYHLRREHTMLPRTMVRASEFRLYLARILLGILLYSAGVWLESHINPWVYEKIFIIS